MTLFNKTNHTFYYLNHPKKDYYDTIKDFIDNVYMVARLTYSHPYK